MSLKKTKSDPMEKYWQLMAKEARKIWSRSSPMRKATLIDSRHHSWTSRMPKHICNNCNEVFSYGDIQVDHVYAVCKSGKVNSQNSYTSWLISLNCPSILLQVLCKDCHVIKTKEDIKK